MSYEANTPATWEQVKILKDASNHLSRVVKHYRHAREKHPFFADVMVREWIRGNGKQCDVNFLLDEARMTLYARNISRNVSCFDILTCELYEIAEAVNRKNDKDAISECYDAIAVLMRMVDVLVGRQKLGRTDGQMK